MNNNTQVQVIAASTLRAVPFISRASRTASTSTSSRTVRGSLASISMSMSRVAFALSEILSFLTQYIRQANVAVNKEKYAAVEAERQKKDKPGFTLSDLRPSKLAKSLLSNPLVSAALLGIAATFLPQDIKENLIEYGKNLVKGIGVSEEAISKFTDALDWVGYLLSAYFGAKLGAKLFDISEALKPLLGKILRRRTTPAAGGKSGKGKAAMAVGGAVLGAAVYAAYDKLIKDESNDSQMPSVPVSGKEKEAFDFFVSKGYTPAQAAGIVGNLKTESQLNPTAYNKKEDAYGIAQWRGSRKEDFKQRFNKPIEQSTFKEQLEFIDYELNNKEKKAGVAIRNSTTPQEAAFNVARKYERAAHDETGALDQRIANAENILASMLENNTPSTKTSGVVPPVGALGSNIAPPPDTGIKLKNTTENNNTKKEELESSSVTAGSLPAKVVGSQENEPSVRPRIPSPTAGTTELDSSLFFSHAL